MRSLSPYGTLILLLLAAAAIIIGGGRLAGRTERVHLPGDRAPVQALADGMQRELARLERLYAGHLRRVAEVTAGLGDDRQGIWQQCRGVVGISQWSLIHPGSKAASDLHILIDTANPHRLPEPVFVAKKDGLPREQVILSSDDFLHPGGETSGWIDEPGKPLFFLCRVSDETVVVLLIDPEPLQKALVPWFTQWVGDALAPIRAPKESVAAIGPDGRPIASTGTKPDTGPDFLLPIRSRFGPWQVAAWDRVETRTFYDETTQAATLALAMFVALLGVYGFIQHRRMLVVAAQRVSFVNRVSHELRTPLTNILLNLDLAVEGLEDDYQHREPVRRLAMVTEETQRLGRLIDNVLAFSRRERGQKRDQPRTCIPNSLIKAVVDQFAPSFSRRGLTVRLNGGVADSCVLDADAFSQILSNLLSNVEKYAPGGIVEIAARLADAMLTVTVTDEGPGIPARAAERIFQPFERLDGRVTEGASGTGLGLAIARELAHGTGGSLRLVPSDRGASFELCMPAPPGQAPRTILA